MSESRTFPTTQKFIEWIHDEVDLRELVESKGWIKDMKSNGMASCIFHSGDHTPSLQIGDAFFRCYSCQAKGDAIKFVELLFNTDFLDAVNILAEQLSATIRNKRFKSDPRKTYVRELWEKYLADVPKMDREALATAEGLKPLEFGYNEREDYVVLAYTSKSGQIMGFTSRRVDREGQGQSSTRPKWKHSTMQDTMIGEINSIFNLGPSARYVQSEQELIIVEGPRDCLGYILNGKKNVVAVSGTGNVTHAIDFLLPFPKIVISMDGDGPGQHAAITAGMHLLSKGFSHGKIEVVQLPDGADPYDYRDSIPQAYDDRQPWLEWAASRLTEQEAWELRESISSYDQASLSMAIAHAKSMTISQANQWIDSGRGRIKAKPNATEELSEKEKLLAIINMQDIEGLPLIDPDKARKILRMKYGITVE